MSTEHDLLVDAVRTLARERIAPRAAEVDRTSEFPWDAVELLREADVFALAFPEEYGGTGTGTLTHLRAVEELSWADATVGLVLAVQGLGGLPVLLAGSEAQRVAYLPRFASGEWLAAYALTEPGAGSDAQAITTTARPDGDGWVIDGTKRFITNAGVAQVYTVFAQTGDGISAILVHADDPGFSVGRIEPKMGIKGSTTGELNFDSCRVPADRLIGESGAGFRLAMRVLDRSRPGIAAQALGIAQARARLLDALRRRAGRLRQADRRPAGHPVHAGRHGDRNRGRPRLLYRVGAMIDHGEDGSELTKLSAMCKLACSDAAMRVTTDAVQILGGYGYMQEFPVERLMRDAKITQIYEGTNQIQRVVIARELLRTAR